MNKTKKIEVMGPNGHKEGTIKIETSLKTVFVNNPSTHEQDEKIIEVYNIHAFIGIRYQDDISMKELSSEKDVILYANRVETDLRRKLTYLVSEPDNNTIEDELKRRGYK